MGSMALKLQPFTVADPLEMYGRAMSLRAMLDNQRYRRLQEENLQVKLEDEREQLAESRNLRDLFRTNPNATPQDVMAIAPRLGPKFIAEDRLAKTAELTRQKTALDLKAEQEKQRIANLTRYSRDIRGIRSLPEADRQPAFEQLMQRYQQDKVEGIDYGMPLPSDAQLRALEIGALGEKAVMELEEAQREAERKIAAEKRAAEKHFEDTQVKGPLERRKLEAETTRAIQQATGTEPPTGTLREFKEVYYPGWLQSKGVKAPTAKTEMEAYADFRELLRARIGGVPGTDVPKSQALIDQEVEKAKRIAEVTKTAQTDKPLSAEGAKVSAIAATMIPELQELKAAIKAGGRTALAGILSGSNPHLSRLASNAADKVGRLRSGGAVNPGEEARFMGQIARWVDLWTGDTKAAEDAIDGLIQEAQTVSSSMAKQGGSQSPNKPEEPKKKGDPLGIR